MTAKDAQGKELEFDLSLPYWNQEDFADFQKDIAGIEDAEEKQERALEELKEDYDGLWDNLPVDRHSDDWETYDLTREPTFSFVVTPVS